MSPVFHLRIHQKMLKDTQFRFKFFSIFTNIHVSTTATLYFLISILRPHLQMGDLTNMDIKKLVLGTYQSGRSEISQKIFR